MEYFEAAIQGFSLKLWFNFRYTWGISVGGFISSKTAGSLSAVLVEVESFVSVSQVEGKSCKEGKSSGEHSSKVDFW